jgi:pimeloyl-ACP methyl ester carboxylesterase
VKPLRAFLVFVVLVAACSDQRVEAPIATTSTSPRVATTSTAVPTSNRLYAIKHVDFSVSVNDVSRAAVDVFVARPLGRGPFPLIIFNHGLGSRAQYYSPFLDELARRGFVVAGPNFTVDDVDRDGVEITRVIDRLTSSTSPLGAGVIDSRHIAVLGHSYGALTALAVTYNSCCRDKRISAAITIEGSVGTLPNGTFTWSGAPLLIVLGDNDPLVPPLTGKQLLSKFRGTAYLLTVIGGDHGGGLDNTDRAHPAVLRTILDFLNAYLEHDSNALHTLRAAPSRSHTRLTHRR